MNSIDIRLRKIQKEKRIGLMTHVVVGYPSLFETVSLVETMERAGADFIELQIPFSDPLADGPTIMKACEKALRKGVRVRDAFRVAAQLKKKVEVPLLFMAYYNNVFKYGVKRFCTDAKKAGVSGLIIPDMPIDEEHGEHFFAACKKNNLYAIRVISPVSTIGRLKKNAKGAKGFVYCMARQGTTGAQKKIDPNVVAFLKKVKEVFKIPVAVGFGISKKEHVDLLKRQVDIVIVGSAIIDAINRSNRKEIAKSTQQFIESLIKVPR